MVPPVTGLYKLLGTEGIHIAICASCSGQVTCLGTGICPECHHAMVMMSSADQPMQL